LGGTVTAPASPTSGGTGGTTAVAGAGVTNTGGGGGGGGSNSSGTQFAGGAGGSGVVIIAYLDTFPAITTISGLTYDQPTRSGYRVYRFTAGTGTITW
jgi:hypothetical protein